VRRYDRLIADFKFYAARPPGPPLDRLEAGAPFTAKDRVYNLVVFQVSPEQHEDSTESRREQALQSLRTRMELLLRNTRIESGDWGMCRVIASAPYFSRNADAVQRAVACAVNPYQTAWPAPCRQPSP
jgi:hypothetical protein